MIVRSAVLHPWRYEFRHGPPKNPHFRERFQQVATDAALLIGTLPTTATPVAFWLDRLFQHCLVHWPDYVFGRHLDSEGGSLELLCEASAAYCAWWDRHIIEITGRKDSDVDSRTIAVIDALNQMPLGPITDEEVAAYQSIDERDPQISTSPLSNRQRIEAFINRIFETKDQRITRTDIWVLAGYKEATQFERFQREAKVSKASKANFDRVLNMSPEEFIERLDRKRKGQKIQ